MKVSIKDGYVRIAAEPGTFVLSQDLLPQEVERLIVELRKAANAIYSARKGVQSLRPFYK